MKTMQTPAGPTRAPGRSAPRGPNTRPRRHHGWNRRPVSRFMKLVILAACRKAYGDDELCARAGVRWSDYGATVAHMMPWWPEYWRATTPGYVGSPDAEVWAACASRGKNMFESGSGAARRDRYSTEHPLSADCHKALQEDYDAFGQLVHDRVYDGRQPFTLAEVRALVAGGVL